jgi:outer membrane protein OmpA-like peptidoglycan-associated protein
MKLIDETGIRRRPKSLSTLAALGALVMVGILLGACGSNEAIVQVKPLNPPSNFSYSPGAGTQPLENGIPLAQNSKADTVSAPNSVASIPADTLFDTGSYQLVPGAQDVLQQAATQIQMDWPDASFEFVGHTDSRGSDRYNQTLSQQRAQTVLNWFRTHGFASNKMVAIGVGSTQPLVPDVDASGQFIATAGAKNRRVDIVLKP